MKLFILLLFIPQFAYSHGGGEEEGSKIGKGITAFDKHDGFKLSAESQVRMKFAYKKVDVAGSITIPKESLVLALNEVHVYTHVNDFFKAIDVKITSKTKDSYLVSSSQLKSGAEVVVKGVNFLRVIDMDLSIGEEHEEGEHSDEHGEHSEKGEHHD
jgi:hypothetical protein